MLKRFQVPDDIAVRVDSAAMRQTVDDIFQALGMPAEDAARARRHLAAVDLPTGLDALPGQSWRAETLVAHMHHDKKVRNGKVTFILARGIGNAFIEHDVDLADVETLLAHTIAA